MKKPLWFRRKTYGWGWYPSSWQGWIIIAVGILLIVLSSLLLESHPSLYFISVFSLVGLIVLIAYLTGEKPKWQWGNK